RSRALSSGQSDKSGPDVNFNVTNAFFHVPNEPRFASKRTSVILLHDNETRAAVIDQLKTTQEMLNELRTLLESSAARQVRRASRPGTETVPARLRATEQGQRGNR